MALPRRRPFLFWEYNFWPLDQLGVSWRSREVPMGSNLNPQQQGWLDRLVNLFRSNPPEQAAAELEQLLKEKSDGPEPHKPKIDDLSDPVTRYKGVTF